MTRTLLVLTLAVFSSCLEPTGEPDAGGEVLDAGLPDGGSLQCSADGTSCWEPRTYCESSPCTYQFPDTGGTCGGQPIRPSCGCARDATGFHSQCTGGCPSLPDGGFQLICLTPDCGSVRCGTGTTCVGFGRCE